MKKRTLLCASTKAGSLFLPLCREAWPGEAHRASARNAATPRGRPFMKDIADLLDVTARTVAFHKYTIMENLGLKTSAPVAAICPSMKSSKKRSRCSREHC